MLDDKHLKIIEEYFLNGFNKSKAFEKYNPREKYKNNHSFHQSVHTFFKREDVKAHIKEVMEGSIGSRAELIDELLYQLKENVFCRPTDASYSYADKQKDIQLLIKIAGIDKAPKFKDEIETTEDINIVLID